MEEEGGRGVGGEMERPGEGEESRRAGRAEGLPPSWEKGLGRDFVLIRDFLRLGILHPFFVVVCPVLTP